MKAAPDNDYTVAQIIGLKTKQLLVVNPEYQRGLVWTPAQKQRLVDSVLRGYPIPLMYFHLIEQREAELVSQRFEIIDGQQRIDALSDFHAGAFKLLDPVKDEAIARFPDFVKKQPCPWAGRTFQELEPDLQDKFLKTPLRVVKIETDNDNEARDLFVRLQAGMPLNSQEKRDAWPGQFTDFVLRLGGKAGLAKYPGHEFFNILMGARRSQDRGKFRQLSAQIAMLLLTRQQNGSFCDTNSRAIDDYYYENLGFDANTPNARRLVTVLDKITALLRDQKRPRIIGHEAIHLVLIVDSLLDDYTQSWESKFAEAFDKFRENLGRAKLSRNEQTPNEYWLRYGLSTRANSDRRDVIQQRHEFFAEKMREILDPTLLDSRRMFGALERELIYYRDNKRCAKCKADVVWDEAEIHHVEQHSQGGRTTLDNGALVHRHYHPKGAVAEAEFAKKWREGQPKRERQAGMSKELLELMGEDDDDEVNGESAD